MRRSECCFGLSACMDELGLMMVSVEACRDTGLRTTRQFIMSALL